MLIKGHYFNQLPELVFCWVNQIVFSDQHFKCLLSIQATFPLRGVKLSGASYRMENRKTIFKK